MPVYHGTTLVNAIYHGETAATSQAAVPVLSWTPASIASSLHMWLDASVVSSLTIASDAVSEWRDQSGNGRHATQPQSVSRPIVHSLSGQIALLFDGVNDFFTIPLLPEAIAGSFDLFAASQVVLTGRGNAAGQAAVFRRYASDLDPAGSYFAGYSGSGRIGVSHHLIAGENVDGGIEGPLSQVVSTSPQLMFWGYNSAGGSTSESRWAMRIDGGGEVAESIDDGGAEGGNGGGSEIGRSGSSLNRHFSGTLAEIVATNAGLSTADREKVEGYLAHKWRFTDRLPASHPYKTSPP